MNIQAISNNALEPTVRALGQLSPSSQGAVIALVRQLAVREGINVALSQSPGLQSPIEGVPLWLAKLRAERYSARTTHMYEYLARRYLQQNPTPTKFGVQSYLAERLEKVSPAAAINFGRRRESAPTLYDELKRLGLEPRDIVQALVESHPAMERYVYGGQALRLMFVECRPSAIMGHKRGYENRTVGGGVSSV